MSDTNTLKPEIVPAIKQWPAIMVDLETMGNNPRSPILSIGAVAFDPLGSEPLEELPSFYVNVSLQSCLNVGLTADASTIMWWMSQSEEARKALLDPAPIAINSALKEFYEFFIQHATAKGKLWAHATFDPVILRSAGDAAGVGLPWSHRNTRDIRTIVDLAAQIGMEIPASGAAGENAQVKHKADDDARYQVGYVRQMYQAVIGRVKKAA